MIERETPAEQAPADPLLEMWLLHRITDTSGVTADELRAALVELDGGTVLPAPDRLVRCTRAFLRLRPRARKAATL